jgi:hypothetical protein
VFERLFPGAPFAKLDTAHQSRIGHLTDASRTINELLPTHELAPERVRIA